MKRCNRANPVSPQTLSSTSLQRLHRIADRRRISPFDALHPDIARWCAEHLRTPTPPQQDALPPGLARNNLLVASPTGTGKTLAAFLPIFSRLACKRDADELFPRTYALYISPLRALGYDVEHNLRRPLREIGLLERPNSERAQKRRGRLRERFVRTGVRTGDTPQQERRLLLARPPHILVTTPESLAVMLAMESYRRTLRTIETVVIDEVHAIAGNKRGSQLALLLESLEELVDAPFNRVGLSATVAPLDRVANFVTGGRPCEVVDHRGLRAIEIDIDVPFTGAVAPLAKVAHRAAELAQQERTTLVFTNVRSQAERVAHFMREVLDTPLEELGEENAPRKNLSALGVHHSALERSVRHRVEAALRAGDLRTVVCSSSLELGVDIGCIDRVLIVGGARGTTASLQRIGRAGHRPGAVARGSVIAQDRDDIIEAAATRRCIADGQIDEVAIPQAPLDVLAQWMVGSVCYDKRVTIDELLRIARRTYPYRSLERDDVVRTARYLSGSEFGGDAVHVQRLGFDGNAIYGLGREVCSAYFENVGTIPDEQQTFVRVVGDPNNAVGRVEESFASDLKVGDVFVLNGRALRVREINASGVVAEPSSGRPTVPQWSSHMKGVPPALAREIAHLRLRVAELLTRHDASEAHAFLRTRYGLDSNQAAHVVRYIAQQQAISAVPSPTKPIVEVYRVDGRQSAVFHTCAGRRVNETLGRLVGARVFAACGANSEITTDDNGFIIVLPRGRTLPDALWERLLGVAEFERDLLEGLRSSHLLRNHFRYVANTGLLVLRRAAGRSLRRSSQRWNSAKIFERLWYRDRNFPLLRETLRTVTRDLLDAPAALAYLEALEGPPRVLHPPAASPFTFGIITSSFGDTVVLDDRATMVDALHERVLEYARGPQVELAPGAVALTHGVLWLEASRTLIAADAHLAYEEVIGGALPLWSTDESLRALLALARHADAREIVLLGDVIHGSRMSPGAADKVGKTLAVLREQCALTLIAGNHEGRTRGRAVLGATHEAIERDGWTLVHGDRPVTAPRVIAGHLHPSVALGGGAHAPAFVASPRLIVVPALTPYSNGLNVLSSECTQALERFVKSTDGCNVVVSTPERVYPFGSLERLRNLSKAV
jgi:ATP-dependent helicase Lhr and Lhr-like helicase